MMPLRFLIILLSIYMYCHINDDVILGANFKITVISNCPIHLLICALIQARQPSASSGDSGTVLGGHGMLMTVYTTTHCRSIARTYRHGSAVFFKLIHPKSFHNDRRTDGRKRRRFISKRRELADFPS